MKKISFLFLVLFLVSDLMAQIEPSAGSWKTWFLGPAKEWRLPAPPKANENGDVLSRQKNGDAADLQQIYYWNAGSPGYRWQNMMDRLWMTDTSKYGALANMLLGAATYDATVAAWDTKYAYMRSRPFQSDNRIHAYIFDPGSPSYPCEHSVAAGVGATIIAHFYPRLADSAKRMAERAMESRIRAGVAYPTDTRAGFELGKKIAEREIELTKNFIATSWDGKRPVGAGYWKGDAMFPQAGKNKTVVLDSSNEFRPAPPPDFKKDMEELQKFKPNFRSNSNAYFFAGQPFWQDVLHKKIFEYNIHLNAPRAARLYAFRAIAEYDCFAACWDAKYAYWGTRPDQYDTTFRPVLYTPPFPGYPSGHAMMSGMLSELYSYFFPAEKVYFANRAKDAAESRFQGGIHFRSDNEVGLETGKKVARKIIQRAMNDGSDPSTVSRQR